MGFLEFLIWLLGGAFIFAFVICLIVFTLAYIWGKLEEMENIDEE